jgi:multidrug efflux pump subunit AcrA (membrane-fusion protein)
MKKFFQRFFFLPLIFIAAVAFVIFQVKSKPPIEHEERGYPVKPVKVITAKKIPFRVRATAFGNVEPAVVLKVKSEVSGKISYMHPKLKQGESLKKGTLVLRIEPTTFNISLNQSKAGLAGSKSTLTQLETEEKSTKRSLKIAQNNLKIGIKEVNRIKSLWNKRLIARSTLDKEEQKALSLRQQVQDIEGKLASFASRKEATRAQINQSRSLVNKSKDTLGKTEIRLPFDARIGTVFVEEDEFTVAGNGNLFEALGVKAIEINAQLPTKQFRPLVAGISDINNSSISLADPAKLQQVISKMDLQARVRLVGGLSQSTFWEGKLIRMSESVDPVRDTLGLVIRVDEPYEGVIPGKRPPLLKGMYTSVELLSPIKPTLVIPLKAIHQGRVYLASDDNTLVIQPIQTLFAQGNMVVLDSQENSKLIGKQIIISDVIPVMEGIPVKAIADKDYEKQFLQEALGKHSSESTTTSSKPGRL